MYSEHTKYNPGECRHSHVQYFPIINVDLISLLKEQSRHINWLGLFKKIKTYLIFEGVFLKTLCPKLELEASLIALQGLAVALPFCCPHVTWQKIAAQKSIWTNLPGPWHRTMRREGWRHKHKPFSQIPGISTHCDSITVQMGFYWIIFACLFSKRGEFFQHPKRAQNIHLDNRKDEETRVNWLIKAATCTITEHLMPRTKPYWGFFPPYISY